MSALDGDTRRVLVWALVAFLVWAVAAYLLLPRLWRHHEHQPGIKHMPMVTQTKQGIPGDPINVGLVGSEDDILHAMAEAGWRPADPVTLKSSIAIVGSVLLRRPDPEAPVSPLFYGGRQQDLAFEKEVGRSADRRDHVRFWKVLDKGVEDAPVWLGSATYDRGVGVSHYTGAVTHHIGPDVDAVRGLLIDDLKAAGVVRTAYQVTGLGPTLFGRNGGGDPYYTDGEIWFARLMPNGEKNADPPTIVTPPPAVVFKDAVWKQVAGLVGAE